MEKTMTTITKEITEEIKGLKKILMAQIVETDALMDVDADGFEALKTCIKLIDESCDYMMEYAAMMEELDMILEKLEERA